jgi:hypothetical protein
VIVIQKENKMSEQKDYLTLKWGTLKSWSFHSDKAKKLLKEYGEIGSSVSAMLQHDTTRQKEIICELIDEGDFETVCLDWDGKDISKEEAKKYVMEYK